MDPDTLRQWLWVALAVMGLALLAAILLAAWMVNTMRFLNIPKDADFVQTLRATPLLVVVVLDLLDLALDIFSAPIAWFLLGRLGLGKLRTVTVVEALIPGTQLVPTMTLAWLGVRLLKLERMPLG